MSLYFKQRTWHFDKHKHTYADNKATATTKQTIGNNPAERPLDMSGTSLCRWRQPLSNRPLH